MQPPPPFESPGGPVKKKNSALPFIIIGGVLVCCVGPIALIGGGGYYLAGQTLPLGECSIAFSGVSSSLKKYAAANDGKLPPAATWQTDLEKYYEGSLPPRGEMGPITVPRITEDFGCGQGGSKTAIVFNTAFAGKKLAEIKDPTSVIVFETSGPAGKNKTAAYKDQGKAASPKMMGNPRGWFALNASLEPVLVVDGRQAPMGNMGQNPGGKP